MAEYISKFDDLAAEARTAGKYWERIAKSWKDEKDESADLFYSHFLKDLKHLDKIEKEHLAKIHSLPANFEEGDIALLKGLVASKTSSQCEHVAYAMIELSEALDNFC